MSFLSLRHCEFRDVQFQGASELRASKTVSLLLQRVRERIQTHQTVRRTPQLASGQEALRVRGVSERVRLPEVFARAPSEKPPGENIIMIWEISGKFFGNFLEKITLFYY